MFIILPVGMNYRTERAPMVTFTLMGLNILVYLVSLVAMLMQGSDAAEWIYQHLWLIPAYSIWYTYVTAMFVHSGILHLVGNMVYLFLFGCCVEDMIGRWRFLALYLIGGLLANFAYIGLSPEHFASEIPLGGASGAISTCMGAYLLLRHDVDIEFKYFGFFFFRFFAGEFSLAAWIVITFWFLKDAFFLWLSYHLETSGGGVAFGAHIGGFVVGLAAIAFGKLLPSKQGGKAVEQVRVRPAAVLPSPLDVSEAADAPATIYVYQADTQYGPYNLFQIREMLSQGSVVSEAQYWSEGMPEWRGVAELATVEVA